MLEKEIIIPELNNKTIESMIYIVRGERVMLDFELAKIYGYSTKAFNQQVSRNISKFPVDLMFKLTKEEVTQIVRSQNVTSDIWTDGKGGRAYLPHVFTEQGVYMLMTVLKGELAAKQSLALIRAFKQMKDVIIENRVFLTANETIKLTNLVNDHSKRLDNVEEKLENVMENCIDPSTYKHYLILHNLK